MALVYSAAVILLPRTRETILKRRFRFGTPTGVEALVRKTQVRCIFLVWLTNYRTSLLIFLNKLFQCENTIKRLSKNFTPDVFFRWATSYSFTCLAKTCLSVFSVKFWTSYLEDCISVPTHHQLRLPWKWDPFTPTSTSTPKRPRRKRLELESNTRYKFIF